MKPTFHNEFTHLEKQIIHRLAEIEQEDANACENCGAEDCICCEVWHDRQKWVSAEELFDRDDPMYDDYWYHLEMAYEEEYGDEE